MSGLSSLGLADISDRAHNRPGSAPWTNTSSLSLLRRLTAGRPSIDTENG